MEAQQEKRWRLLIAPVTVLTSDWTVSQPVVRAGFELPKNELNVLRIVKTDGGGTLVKNADIEFL